MYIKGKLFTYIALYLAVFFLAFQWFFTVVKAQSGYELPLLLLLLMNELAMFICLFGAWAGIQLNLKQGFKPIVAAATLACIVLALLFLYLGIQHWPEDIALTYAT